MNDPCSSNTPSRAFVAAPDPQRYFPATAIEEARQKISRCIDRGEGPALLVGPAGTGKTLLLEVLAQQFRDQRVLVSLPGAQLCSRRALLQMILVELGLPFRGLDEGELRVSLLSHLRPQNAPPRRMLLLVDEAESLPARLLEELRVLTNVADQGTLLVSLVLAGNATLEERFAEPMMETLSQRVATRCYLSALGREETFQYIRAQVAATGSEPDQLFLPDGLEALFAATDGVPRLLNQLGNQLLWMAEETGYSPLDGTIVQQAWSELQQLPAPWDTTSANLSESVVESAVEFGELSLDEHDPLERAFSEETGETEIDEAETQEAEDDLPASISLYSSQSGPEACYAETFDATEQLVEQLHELETAGSVAIPPLSQNPFAESFDSEEVVLDRYLEFEDQLLATAQRVLNQVDTTFAQQLSHCEVNDCEMGETALTCETTTTQLEEIAPLVCDSLSEEPVAEEPLVCESELSELGELLVIEDLGHSAEVKVVPGSKYRQLFSSLADASWEPPVQTSAN
ncbi:MAG: AAA family ATPase [Planctomycetes bacterium]|nr:AAA family ATPase [Planctomycetota bacterium]